MANLSENGNTVEIIQEIEACTTPSRSLKIFLTFLKSFGLDSYLIGRMANPASQTKNDIHTNWPAEWIRRWIDENYVFHDPIFQYALRNKDPFLWSTAIEHGSKLGKKIIQESREFNLRSGIAVPISTDFGPLGCVTLGSEKDGFVSDEMATIELVSIHIYQHLQILDGHDSPALFGVLTKRETEVLHFVAEGKTNWEIGKILNLSEFSVKDHVHNLTQKLRVSNRTQAVAVAIRNGLIIP